MSTSHNRQQLEAERTLRALMQSMSKDAPRPASKRAIFVALGLGAAGTGAAGTAGAVGIAGAAKFVFFGVLSGLAVTGVVVGVQSGLPHAQRERSQPALVVRSRSPSGPRRTSPPVASSASSEERPRSESTPAVAVQATPATPRSSPHSERSNEGMREDVAADRAAPPTAAFEARPTSASSLRAEVAALDRARSALARGDAPTGLTELETYAAHFPRGALAQEATLLRIQALTMTGERAQAQKAARSFLASHPSGPHVEKLRELLDK
ncbi:MAG: outer membrane protein assembly factor BamD [Polyangiaceae bacterium]